MTRYQVLPAHESELLHREHASPSRLMMKNSNSRAEESKLLQIRPDLDGRRDSFASQFGHFDAIGAAEGREKGGECACRDSCSR